MRLLMSDRIELPLMFSWWRPVVVLPGNLCGQGDSAALRYCLAHEWSHVERRDAWRWHLATRRSVLLLLSTALLVAAAATAALSGLPGRRPRGRASERSRGLRGIPRRSGPAPARRACLCRSRNRRSAFQPVPENRHVAAKPGTPRTTLSLDLESRHHSRRPDSSWRGRVPPIGCQSAGRRQEGAACQGSTEGRRQEGRGEKRGRQEGRGAALHRSGVRQGHRQGHSRRDRDGAAARCSAIPS